MAQNAKIIDITRSFIPIDPNRFPETMHDTGKEDSPESRSPVVPYMGKNFMPTARGYKSAFGTNSALDIDSLSPNEADAVFIYQTETYLNIACALCDTGIWYKNATETGAWNQAVVFATPDEGVLYEWFYFIIKNKLYIWRSASPSYYVVETDPDVAIGVTITTVTPTFITLTLQQGMTRFGGRVGFWDTNNAISWSAADDLSDFTPAVLTGANVTTFNSIQGKIADIKPHGKHCIAYASKSIVFLEVSAGDTFLIKATPIITGAGTAYKKQSVAATPDTTHFAYTDTGIWKIENAKEELILAEFFDYMKQYTAQPVYLKALSGRFLCFEIIDPDALNGNVIFSKAVVPPSTLTFAGLPESLEEVHEQEDAENVCDIIQGLNDGTFSEMQDDATAAGVPGPNDRYPGSSVTPIYTCYLALSSGPVQPIDWTFTPCGATKIDGSGKFHMSPTGDGGKLSQFSTDATNKTAKAGDEVWTDGKWTMERFVQYQSAIWKSQEEAMQGFVQEIDNRSETPVVVITQNTNSCTVAVSNTDCDIGRFPLEFSEYQFGFNKCSFWLTRYALSGVDINNRTHEAVSCSNNTTDLGIAGYMPANGSIGTLYGNTAAAAATYGAGAFFVPLGANNTLVEGANTSTSNIGYVANGLGVIPGAYVYAAWIAATGKIIVQLSTGTIPTAGQRYVDGFYDKNHLQSTTNNVTVAPPFSPTPETAYCVISGWEYTDANGNTQTVTANSCDATGDSYPQSDAAVNQVPVDADRPNHIDGDDGAVCGLPSAANDALDPSELSWPDQTVTYAGTNFLLQNGSVAPVFPTIYGNFLYDLHLKKWGKMNFEYKQLLDYSPLNSVSNSPVDFTVFGILAGVLKEDGFIYVFDDEPEESYLTWGKIGYYRKGMTDLQEVRIDFARISTGTVVVEGSLDGQSLGTELVTTQEFTSAKQVSIYPQYAAKWHNVTVTGKYDISLIETIGLQKGRM